MFTTKKDVDRHVRTSLSKLRTDNEKNLRGYTIAKMYYKIGEYASAQHYVSGYLSVKEDYAPAHRLLGQCYAQLKKPEKALSSYQKSLQLDPKQQDLVIEVCQFLLSDELNLTSTKAKYWYELAEAERIQHDAVFNLKLKVLKQDNMEVKQIEELILKEIVARPTDPSLRIRLIKHYLDQNKISEAFTYAYEIEMKNNEIFMNSIDWYNTLAQVLHIFKNSDRKSANSWEYWLMSLTTVERQIYLYLSADSVLSYPQNSNLQECSNLLFEFDQLLNVVAQTGFSVRSELSAQFLYHFRGQLCLHAASLLFKREKVLNKNQWWETTKNCLPLLMFAFQCGTPDTQESWLKHANESTKQLFQLWNQQGAFRCSQAGRTLLSCINETKENTVLAHIRQFCSDKTQCNSRDELLIQIRKFCSDQSWRKNLFRLLFTNSDQVANLNSSYLATCNSLNEPKYDLPSIADLESYEEIAQWLHPSSLQYLVYINLNNNCLSDLRCKMFDGLNFSISNLLNCNPETLNQLDVETFLCAAIIQANRSMEVEKHHFESYNSAPCSKPSILPYANMAMSLCTEEQISWWTAAYKVCKNYSGENLAELRATLQDGLEAIRCVGSPRMDLMIVLRMGQIFQQRLQESSKSVGKVFLEARTETLYKCALHMLKLSNKGSLVPFRKIFKYSTMTNCGDITSEINILAEEAVTFLASRYFKNSEYEECIEEFVGLDLPFATYFQAEAYRKLDESNKTPKKTKKLYLDKARDYFNQTLTLLENPNIDKNHPLKSIIHSEIKRLQFTNKFATDEAANGYHQDDDYYTEQVTPRARRDIMSTPKSSEIENLIKQIIDTLSLVQGQICDIRKDVTDMKSQLFNIEETVNLKVLQQTQKVTASSVLDDFYRLEDEEARRQQISPTTATATNDFYNNVYNTPYPMCLYYQMQGGTPTLTQQPLHRGGIPIQQIPGAPSIAAFSDPTALAALNPQSPQVIQRAQNIYDMTLGYQQQLAQQTIPQIQPQLYSSPQLTKPGTSAIEQALANPSLLKTWNSTYNNAPVEKSPPVNVVITSSDPLPTHTTITPQPLLSVTIPPQHIKNNLISNEVLSNTNFPALSGVTKISSITNNILEGQSTVHYPDDTLNRSEDSITNEEYDPCPNFKPIIPLPDKIEIKTGEENEETYFCARAKLLRLVNKEWKERGLGDMKILKNKTDGKIRILMRREQVHKICANHAITADMKLVTMKNTEKSFIWAANDFADEVLKLEKFCVRFKTPEIAKDFKDAFERAKKEISDRELSDEATAVTTSGSLPIESKPLFGGFGSITTPTLVTQIKKSEPQVIASEPMKSVLFGTTTTTTATTTVTSQTANKSIFSFVMPSSTESKSKESTTAAATITTATTANSKPNPFAAFSFGQTTDTKEKSFASIFSGLNKSASEITTVSPVKATENLIVSEKTAESPLNKLGGAAEETDDYIPTAQFQPVIPLPELIEVKTGEENENTLFEHRAKLLRYDTTTKEWKERGIGIIKILVNNSDHNKVRLLMRREQVLKLCCNQLLTKDTKFNKLPNTETALSWCGQDFSENELRTEMFAIRFKTTDVCKMFHDAILEAQKGMTNENIKEAKNIAGKDDKKETTNESQGFGNLFKPKPGNWECKSCYISNKSDSLYCAACNDPKDNTVPPKQPVNVLDLSTTPSSKFTFGIPPSTTTPETKASDVTKGASPAKEGFGNKFKPKVGSWECKNCYISNKANDLYCVACESPKDNTVPKKESQSILDTSTTQSKFSFGMPPATTDVAVTSSPFSFGSVGSTVTTQPSSGGFTFGTTNMSNFTFGFGNANNTTTTSSFVSPVSSFSFGVEPKVATEDITSKSNGTISTTVGVDIKTDATPANDNIDSKGFSFESKGFDFIFKPKSPGKVKSPGGPTKSGDESDEECIEEDNNTYFTPVIPLPEKIEIKTGEEEEECLYSHRAKLYRFVDSEWKERGIGDVKILKHKTTNKLRVVMRRDQVLKICLNHVLSKDIEYKRKDDKSWHFVVNDYSEGELELMQFCLRFKTSDIANDFKDAIDNALGNELTSHNNFNGIDESASLETTVIATTNNISENSNIPTSTSFSENISVEDKKLAEKLLLPIDFFDYKNKTDCQGCRGCESDNFVLSIIENINDDIIDDNPLPLEMSNLVINKIELQSNTPKIENKLQKSPASIAKNLFGTSSPAEATKSPTSIFGGLGGGATTFSPTTSIFGGSSENNEQKSSNIFSLPTKTTSSFIFGSGSTTFGAISTAPTFDESTTVSPSNANVTNVSSLTFSSPSVTTQPTIFGSANKTSGTMFGGTAGTFSFGGTSLFGGTKNIFEKNNSDTTATTTTNIFGSPQTPVTTTTATGNSGSIFGGNTAISSFSFATAAKELDKPTETTNDNDKKSESDEKKEIVPVPSFGSLNTDNQPNDDKSEPEIGKDIFKMEPGLSFASLASSSATSSFNTSGDGKGFYGLTNNQDFSNLMGKSKNQSNGNVKADEEGATEDVNYDPHYEPIIALPEEISISTGEEEETKLFGERGCLYRFDNINREWKERGIGEFKILHHPSKGTYRFLLRREQIYKLVLNHSIDADFVMNPLNKTGKSYCWATMNYAEDPAVVESLAVRFKNADSAQRFETTVRQCIEQLKQKADLEPEED